ncbi:enoyl-CoA hydratase-related protein [Alicyclobacillus acidocaldarius]|uniref:enoyl-CoA hydratase-related protein n=1 Tax=Alicyclobacillus acidocaldarius TaxID=405212 RepID=UPI00345F1419
MAYLSIHDDGPVRVIRIARDERLNALNLELVGELVAALEAADAEPQVRAVVMTGGDKAFAAGADIAEMADATAVDMKLRDQFRAWDRIRGVHKPVIAAVRGFALGGGCELALACDLVIAGESAKFGQPEVKLGLMPGAGGLEAERNLFYLLFATEDAREGMRAFMERRKPSFRGR